MLIAYQNGLDLNLGIHIVKLLNFIDIREQGSNV